MNEIKLKTRRDVLIEQWNETLRAVVDSEVKLAVLKTKKPDEVIYSKMERVMGQPMEKDFTVKVLTEKEEENWRGQLEVLKAIKKLLKETK